ncbi:hypothetical protein Glove_166g121 [Diversispora epigaea]|uniref:Uncharacterized protein n=1 Tax=Diversispora epigaea TaxID=1348612 RepID=A0A397IQL2_9GLOM|nr:hypothetical protein Glove_166g121 [Diversispora epigaea]
MAICPECNQEKITLYWCNPCNSKRFQNDFNNWTNFAMKICNGLRPKIPFHIPKLITRDKEIVIQIKKAEEFSANQESTNKTTTTTPTPLNYQTHPQAIYTSRLLNYSNLPKPKNEENFERELEELTESMSLLIRI